SHRGDRTVVHHPLGKRRANEADDRRVNAQLRSAEPDPKAPREAMAAPTIHRGYLRDTAGGQVTSKVPPSDLPKTSGSYISAPLAGLSKNVPGVVALATKDATWTPGGR